MWEDKGRGAGAFMSHLFLPITALCCGVQALFMGSDVTASHG